MESNCGICEQPDGSCIHDKPTKGGGSVTKVIIDLREAGGSGSVESKPTNPKDRIGSKKLPLDLVPSTVVTNAALAFLEGALKYGSYNWRVAGVRASIYKAALERHLDKWWNGEWADGATGVPHLASIIACAGIILDANLADKLTDDRPPAVALGKDIEAQEKVVKHLQELFKDHNPVQY